MERESALRLVEHRALWCEDNLSTAIWTVPSSASSEVCMHLGRKRGRQTWKQCLAKLSDTFHLPVPKHKKEDRVSSSVHCSSAQSQHWESLGRHNGQWDLSLYFMRRPVESKNSLEWRIKQRLGIAYSVSKAHLGLPEGLVWRTLKIAVTQCNVFISFNWTALVPGD